MSTTTVRARIAYCRGLALGRAMPGLALAVEHALLAAAPCRAPTEDEAREAHFQNAHLDGVLDLDAEMDARTMRLVWNACVAGYRAGQHQGQRDMQATAINHLPRAS